MNIFPILSFFTNFFLFFAAVFLAFFIPGDLFVKRLRLSFLARFTFSCGLGIALWAVQGMIFGYLSLRGLTYVYLLGTLLLWLKYNWSKKFSIKKTLKKIDKVLVLILFVGIGIQLITVWFIGIENSNGVLFCCFWPDSLYHLALTNQLVHHFPPIEPGASGIMVQNYHYLGNLVIAEMVRVFHLPLLDTQYRYITFFISLLLGLSVIALSQMLGKDTIFTRWVTFFIYFSGDIIFLLLFVMGRGLQFDLTLAERATTLWFSPPRVFAMCLFFVGTGLLVLWFKKRDIYTGLLACFILSSLVGFKIYIGIFALGGLFFLGCYFFYIRKFSLFIPIIVAGVISFSIYFPVNQHASGLAFVGLWRIEAFGIRDQFGLISLELARFIYLQHGNYVKVVLIEIGYFIIYTISLWGVFLLALFQTKKSFSSLPLLVHIYFLPSFIVCYILGILFFQKIGGGNIMQLLFSLYLIGPFYATVAIIYWLARIPKRVKVYVVILLIVLISTRVFYEAYGDIHNLFTGQGFLRVTKQELTALRFVREKTPTDALILVSPQTSISDTCYYLSFMTNRSLYLCGSGIATDHGVRVEQRKKDNQIVFEKNNKKALLVLLYAKIDYIYINNKERLEDKLLKKALQRVFINKEVTIYKVNRKILKNII